MNSQVRKLTIVAFRVYVDAASCSHGPDHRCVMGVYGRCFMILWMREPDFRCF